MTGGGSSLSESVERDMHSCSCLEINAFGKISQTESLVPSSSSFFLLKAEAEADVPSPVWLTSVSEFLFIAAIVLIL